MKHFLILILLLSTPLFAFAQYEDARKGDVVEINGHKAIIFSLDENGHGSAMTIKALRGKKNPWCPDQKTCERLSMSSTDDGYANTQEIFLYCETNNVPLSSFPAFEWCKKLGEGWYIPSEEQLKQFINFWLGNDQEFNWDDEDDETGLDLDAGSPKEINEKIMNAGGTPFFTGVYSSTMKSDGKIVIYDYNENKGTWRFRNVKPTSMKMFMSGRACYDF